jgi:hypothetical protein
MKQTAGTGPGHRTLAFVFAHPQFSAIGFPQQGFWKSARGARQILVNWLHPANLSETMCLNCAAS